MKKLFIAIKDNLDLTSDIVSIAIAVFLIVRYQTIIPKPDDSELLIGIMGILATIALSGIIEKRSRLSRIEDKVLEVGDLIDKKVINKVRADEFFSRGNKIKSDFFNSAENIGISGITLSNTSSEFSHILGQRLKAGANIRIILLGSSVSPLEQIVKRSWGETTPEYYKNRLENTTELLRIVENNNKSKGKLQIGYLPYVPSFGITLVDADSKLGAMYVEIYHHNSDEPSPSFYLTNNSDPYWFKFFSDQFEIMWKESKIS